MIVTWIIEDGVFSGSGSAMSEAATVAGHTVVPWEDCWWSDSQRARIGLRGRRLRDGSRAAAARIKSFRRS